jgi:3-oxoacid CoA-transferase subunit B
VVHGIITDLCVFDVTADGLVQRELAPDVTLSEIMAKTEPAVPGRHRHGSGLSPPI